MPSNALARWIALIAALAGALLWVVFTSIPPAPRGTDTPPTDFSAVRAMEAVRAVGREPHVLGSDADARVRAWLIARLKMLGAEVSEQPVPLDPKGAKKLANWQGGPAVTGTNIIARLPGRDRSLPAVAIMAHHDSVAGSPGAADDGIGLATAIETLRAIRATGHPPERDVIILLTDGEETGLNGAKVFFASPRNIGALVNLDARGAGGRANMFETGRGNGAMMRLYAGAVARPAANSVSVLVYDRMPNSTDYTPAKARGIPGFNIAPLDRAWTYHSPLSTPAALDPGTLQDMGDQTLGLIRAMAFARELPPQEPDAAFADLVGRWLIVYPVGWGWAVLGAALLLFLIPLRSSRAPSRDVGMRDRVSTSLDTSGVGRLGGGIVVALAFLAHTALLLTALNALSGSGDHNYYDRLAALPCLETQAWLAVAALLAVLPLMRRLPVRLLAIVPAQAMMWIGLLSGGPLILLVLLAVIAMGLAAILPDKADGPAGSTVLLAFVAIVTQVLAPTAAPFFAWPLLLAAIGAVARTFLPPVMGLAVTAIVAAIGIGHIGSMAHFVMLALGAELPLVLAVALLAGMPLLWPLLPERGDWRVAMPLLVVAIGVALWVRFDAIAPSVATYSLSEGAKTK